MKATIIDYGMGNLQSVANALIALGHEADIARTPEQLERAHKIVLPGVGSFAAAMANLNTRGWTDALNDHIRGKGKPFLGICLGLQLLAEEGTEHGITRGLGWIAGSVQMIKSKDPAFRLPHIGWNTVRFSKHDGLYQGLGEAGDFYFVNSYVLSPTNQDCVSGTTNHFVDFVSSVEQDNIFATQYHPEKSHKLGLKVLANFMSMKD